MSCFCRPTNKAAFCSKAHSKRSLPARKRSIYTIHTIVHHHSATQVATERSSGHFEGERVGTALPLLKCLRTHYGRHFERFSGQKCIVIIGFRIYMHNLKIFLRVIPPGTRRGAPGGAWTQTSISAWLASLSIVPVLRNDRPNVLALLQCVGPRACFTQFTFSSL